MAASKAAPDYASSSVNSTVSVAASHGRQSPNLNSGEVHSPNSGSDDIDEFLGENDQQEDPTSLQAVLAALGKSQSGKGVKRGRIAVSLGVANEFVTLPLTRSILTNL